LLRSVEGGRSRVSVREAGPLQTTMSRRDPPSFPTRRSSDLRGGGTQRAVRDALLEQLLVVVGGGDVALEQHVRVRVDQAGEEPGDRKSTRLNSSHRTISYAVFCLKKKTPPCGCPPRAPKIGR